MDIGFDLDTMVLEPCNGYYEQSFSKEVFKKRKLPVIITRKLSEDDWYYIKDYLDVINSCDDKMHLGDETSVLYSPVESLKVCLKKKFKQKVLIVRLSTLF